MVPVATSATMLRFSLRYSWVRACRFFARGWIAIGVGEVEAGNGFVEW